MRADTAWRETEVDRRGDEAELPIPASNASNFPALECLSLPYGYYNKDTRTGDVSTWMKRQLRRSYEYERVRDWEAEMVTLGEAELLKALA